MQALAGVLYWKLDPQYGSPQPDSEQRLHSAWSHERSSWQPELNAQQENVPVEHHRHLSEAAPEQHSQVRQAELHQPDPDLLPETGFWAPDAADGPETLQVCERSASTGQLQQQLAAERATNAEQQHWLATERAASADLQRQLKEMQYRLEAAQGQLKTKEAQARLASAQHEPAGDELAPGIPPAADALEACGRQLAATMVGLWGWHVCVCAGRIHRQAGKGYA